MLINLGTPDSPSVPDVRRYLREFLSDPRVLDLSTLGRFLLLNFVILPRRPKQSAEAYRAIWTVQGSPLLLHGQELARKVRLVLGDEVPVELAMRYQNPPIASALVRLKDAGVDRLVVLPLFPQYSSAAWGSAVEKVYVEANRLWNVPAIQVVPPFFDHPAFLDSFADVARPVLAEASPDLVLMSFHGLPQRQVIKSDESGGAHCLRSPTCCDTLVNANRNCYRAQCVATARGIAERLDLPPAQYEITFQSRLGREPWLTPYTDLRIRELAASGVRRLAVLCPAFVADCLETLEEIGIRARKDFLARGGEDLRLVPSLNSDDRWVAAIVRILRESTTLLRDAEPSPPPVEGPRRGAPVAGLAS